MCGDVVVRKESVRWEQVTEYRKVRCNMATVWTCEKKERKKKTASLKTRIHCLQSRSSIYVKGRHVDGCVLEAGGR